MKFNLAAFIIASNAVIAMASEKPDFKFGDRLIIKSGFYQGCTFELKNHLGESNYAGELSCKVGNSTSYMFAQFDLAEVEFIKANVK